MSCSDQLFWVSARLALEAGLERVRRVGQHARVGRQTAVAVLARAPPHGASLANHDQISWSSQVGHSWYVDETYLKVHGRWCYLYRAIDRNGTLVDVLFSEHRDRRRPRCSSAPPRR